MLIGLQNVSGLSFVLTEKSTSLSGDLEHDSPTIIVVIASSAVFNADRFMKSDLRVNRLIAVKKITDHLKFL
jgi:hypothetical protein